MTPGEAAERVTVVDTDGMEFTVSRDILRDTRMEHLIKGESHPVPRYADDGEKTMVSKQTESELLQLKQQVDKLRAERSQTVSVSAPQENVEFIKDGKDGYVKNPLYTPPKSAEEQSVSFPVTFDVKNRTVERSA